MKFFFILLIALPNQVLNTDNILDKEVQFVGPFKKLLDFGYVYKGNEQIKVTWRNMKENELINPQNDETDVSDNSLSTKDCFQEIIDKIEEQKSVAYSTIDQADKKALLKCIVNTKKENKQKVIFENPADDKYLELYPYEKMTLMQNKLRQVLKSFDLVSGVTLDQNIIKSQGQGPDGENIEIDLQLQGASDILSESLKIFDENAAGNKFKVIQKMMVSAVILKKVWQLITTVGGVNLFKCPESLSDTSFRRQKTDPLFTEKLVDLDLISKQILKNLYSKQQQQKIDKIQQLREDYNNSFTTEHYQPLNEINIEVENLTNQQTIIKDSYDFPDPLAQLNQIHTKFEHVSRYCDPTMFKQFPVILPKINVDMFGFTKEDFRLIFDVKRGFKESKTDEMSYIRPEGKILIIMQDILSGSQIEDPEAKENFIKNFEQNINIIKKNLYLGQFYSSVNEETIQISDDKIDAIKTAQDVKRIKTERTEHRYRYWEYTYFPTDPALLIKYLIDPNFLIDKLLETFNNDKNPDWLKDTEYRPHIYIARLKALYMLNYSRLLNHIFTYLKFSPTVIPDSYDFYKMNQSSQQAYKDIQDEEAQKNYFKRPNGKITDAIRADKPLKKKKVEADQQSDEEKGSGEQLAEEVTFKNVSDLTVNLSQNEFNRTASKDHIVYQSFMFFFDNFLKKFVSRDSSLVQCLLPQGQMKRGSQCPIFFKDLMKFVSKNPKLQMDFTSVYGLFISLYESDPNDIKNTIEKLLDQMLVFSRYEYNKLLFEREDIVDELIRKKVFDQFPNDMKFIDVKKRDFFEGLYFELYIYFIGRVVPEFKSYYNNYFFYKYSNKQRVEDLIDKVNQDTIVVPNLQIVDEGEQKNKMRRMLFEEIDDNQSNLI